MSFTTITDPELEGLGVSGLPDTPELSTEDMQAQFDEYPQFLKDKFKVHITEEEANTAASNIGATIPEELDNVTDEQIQPILNELATRVKNQKDWQDEADENFSPTELNTEAFHADATTVTVPTVDTLDISDKAASTAFVDAKMQAIGAGDMAKSTYDPYNRGMVETAYKVESSYVNAITESTATYPVPEEGDKVKDIVGKQIKYAEDLKNDMLSTTDYGTCTTAASTAAKEITVSNDDWSLRTGSVICVLFSNTNTAQDPTFNVNNTGAKSVWYDTGVITDSNIGFAGTSGRPMLFMYNGTCWVFVGWSKDWKSNIDNLTATTAKKSDLTDISITGSTNNTGDTITSGTFFYLNGDLVKAKTSIANGATLTLNTNYEIPTAGALNALNSALNKVTEINTNTTVPYGKYTIDGVTYTLYRTIISMKNVALSDYSCSVATSFNGDKLLEMTGKATITANNIDYVLPLGYGALDNAGIFSAYMTSGQQQINIKCKVGTATSIKHLVLDILHT